MPDSYGAWLDARYDYLVGRPCLNCESDPAMPDDQFCSDECRDEYEGNGDYAE